MKSLKFALVAFMLTILLSTQAKAQNNLAKGLLIGTTVGGIVGLIIGGELNRSNSHAGYVNNHILVPAPLPPPKLFSSRWDRDHSSHTYRAVERRRNVVIIRDQHVTNRNVQNRKIVKTVYRQRR